MSRVYFRKATKGYHAVRGELVRKMQVALQASGAGPEAADGIFGSDTEKALAGYQRTRGIPESGQLDGETWKSLFGVDEPNLLERCLQVTAAFEGHGFGKAVGNFDGAGITWGIIGFTLKHGRLQEILEEIFKEHPECIEASFGSLASQLRILLGQSRPEQIAWADHLSSKCSPKRLPEAWEKAFSLLGTRPVVQAAQLQRVKPYWSRATQDASRFGLTSEAGMALCFDIAVQNGGIDTEAEEAVIRQWIRDNPGFLEKGLLVKIADTVAENSRVEYVKDVQDRKRTIATGFGIVHGCQYQIEDWGITQG